MFTKVSTKLCLAVMAIAGLSVAGLQYKTLESSSHREAPMILNDPLADNTDVYAFRSPTNPDNMVIIANYVPFQHPHGGPNYYNFGENIAYDIHIKNNAANNRTEDILYRFEFTLQNEDPTTFFNIRLGKQNQKATYTLTKITATGSTVLIQNGKVPPNDLGPRSIEGAVGLATNYDALMQSAIVTAASGEKVFCGPVEDPFFVDTGGIFDLGNIRPATAVDGLRKLNVHSIAMEIPIQVLQKDGKRANEAANILDPNYVIGVWASASRKQIMVRQPNGTISHQGAFVQVSRLGMPLTNEVVIPIGQKDAWNNTIVSSNDEKQFEPFFTNPELALYMDDSKFGGAVPGFVKLRVQSRSLGSFDFRNGADGLFPLKGTPAVAGTALDDAAFGNYLLRDNEPRSVDLLPIFMTGVPNLRPYQLATGKNGNPLAAGKPFINNFLPTFGDMLRVNMAVPVTSRNSPDFSSEGLVNAAVLGLTDPRYNTTTTLQPIPNMDGFPNGRRLEDDVTRIELQAVAGIVLAAIGLPYDDAVSATALVSPDLVDVLTFTTGVERNDAPFPARFPFVGKPWDGFYDGHVAVNCVPANNGASVSLPGGVSPGSLNMSATDGALRQMEMFPNPARDKSIFRYRVLEPADVTVQIYSTNGTLVATPMKNQKRKTGVYDLSVDMGKLKNGQYILKLQNGKAVQSLKFVVSK